MAGKGSCRPFPSSIDLACKRDIIETRVRRTGHHTVQIDDTLCASWMAGNVGEQGGGLGADIAPFGNRIIAQNGLCKHDEEHPRN